MEWECHNCGHLHPSIPAACERCGTAPEIVRNVWRCQHCGHDGISSEQARCPACGADRALGVETAVDTGARIEGEQGRRLAGGEWLYCAYCDVQVPPVDDQGRPNEVCPTCKGPLSEAELAAAEQEVSAEQAGQYRAEATRRVGEAPPAAAAAPAPGRRSLTWLWVVLAVVVLGGGGVAAWLLLRGPDRMVVTACRWQRTVDVERFGPVQQEAWAGAVPAGARARSCFRKVHHYNKVAAGTETYEDRVAAGRECASYGYKKKGGVSVKRCKRWRTKYKTVTRTRTRYRRVPVHRQRCRFTVDRWHAVRKLTAAGSGGEPPRWPDTAALAAGKERPGQRRAVYTLTLKAEGESPRRYTCKNQAEFDKFPVDSAVLAETSVGGEITAIRPAR